MYVKLKSYLLHNVIIDSTLKTNLFVNKEVLSVVYVFVCPEDVKYYTNSMINLPETDIRQGFLPSHG